MKCLTVLFLAGCSFQSGAGQGIDARTSPPDIDAATGTMIDAKEAPPIDGQACFGKGLVRVCFTALPTDDVTLDTRAINTANNGDCTLVVPAAAPNLELCVVAGKTVRVTGTVTASGARPLVIVGLDSVTIDAGAGVDVSSVRGGRKGAASGVATCTSITAGENDGGGGGGGGGGGFGTKGGRGGRGDRNESTRGDRDATGGPPGGTQTAAGLRGGCPGGKGGSGNNNNGGAGGDGGGAVYIIAGRALDIAGDVMASGAGGTANPDNGGIEQGAGGGGSGGMIGLDAAMLNISGHIVANGGAGGGGGGLNVGGTPGGDGTTTSWDQRASAGAPSSDNNAGAAGAAGTAVGKTDAVDAGDADGGAGGGAGGLGYIRIDGALTGGMMISPAADKH